MNEDESEQTASQPESGSQCINCKSSDLYMQSDHFYSPTIGGILQDLGGFMSAPRLDVIACGDCGFLMFFLPDREKEQVKIRWKQIEPE